MYCVWEEESSRHQVSLHRFPKKQELRAQWLSSLSLTESDVTEHSRICSMHFRDGNPANIPSHSIVVKFGARATVDSSSHSDSYQ